MPHFNRDTIKPFLIFESFRLEQHWPIYRILRPDCERRDSFAHLFWLATQHITNEFQAIEGGQRSRYDVAPITQNRDAIAHGIKFFKTVADVNDGRPLRL